MNRHQQAVIDYLQEENRVLLEQLDGKPKRFTESQRLRLSRKAKVVGRTRLRQLKSIVTPDTLLRWFRILVAKKWTFAMSHPLGRPPVAQDLEKLVVKLIQDNPSWGSNRIVGALDNLGYTLSDSTIDNIRRRKGLDGAPVRCKNPLAHLSESALGHVDGGGLFHHRSVVLEGTGHILHFVRHRTAHARGLCGWHHGVTECGLDEGGGPAIG
jgi:hypothetical protein